MSHEQDLERQVPAFAGDNPRYRAATASGDGRAISPGPLAAPIARASNPLLAVFRDAAWLTHDRVTAFTRVLLVLMAGAVASSPWTAPAMNIGHDFASFWTAAQLALEGRAGEAYGEAGRAAVAALFGQTNNAPFFYPPIALLLWLPFACVPFATAATLWIAASGTAYAVAIRAMLRRRCVIPALAFPAAWVCALYGQNGLFSTALLGGSAVTLDRYPVFAGVLIGCLTYKPQIALLAPLVLILARRWRALSAAIATTILLALAATAAFGMDSWVAFVRGLPEASAWTIGGAPGFDKFASPYAAVRLLGGSSHVAWLVQLMAALGAIAVLLAMLRKRPGGEAEIALMVTATMLCVPSLGNYEMVLLAIPGAWLISQALTQGWLPYERIALAALYMTPILMVPASANGVPLAPAAILALTTLLARRISHLPPA